MSLLKRDITIFTILVSNSAFAKLAGEGPINLHLEAPEETRRAINLDERTIKQFYEDKLIRDTILDLSLTRTRTPSIWGGNEWRGGVDCSQFTMKINQLLQSGEKTFTQSTAG